MWILLKREGMQHSKDFRTLGDRTGQDLGHGAELRKDKSQPESVCMCECMCVCEV